VFSLFFTGMLYHLYMLFISVFSTNSINILAGINGLEVGQSLIIAVSVLIHSTAQLIMPVPETNPQNSLLAVYLILPFIATSSALLYYNWYPSRVFVGDTFTYFAGMTLSVAAILGHSTKTLMLFFIPQLINFVISLPQLFGWIPCPRHRLPR
jgi:UDP-N-acetylglucosamine--dolichyl-phosphate N-acetylglucosaminephosphotransferase